MVLVELDVSNTSKVLAILGFYVVFFGLFSYTIKERLFISDAMVSLAIGVAVGPIGANWFSPWSWTSGNESLSNSITYEIMRVVIGIQVLFCGINLPKRYLKLAWKSLAVLLVPVLTVAWLVSGAVVFALIPNLTFLDSLVIGAAVAPTDPILANAIVKGRFAEEHVPDHVRELLAAESGANDGLGVPFIYLAIYLMRSKAEEYSTGEAVRRWWISTVLYRIVLSVAVGVVIGVIARKSLKYAERRNLIDHESFLAYGIGLAFFTLGVDGMIGSDDLLSCFVVGNVFTWTPYDDWFRKVTDDHTFQHVIDQLINSAVFIYVGTIIPWSDFGDSALSLSPGRLVAVAVLILFFRRLPVTLLTHKIMPDVRSWREAAFTGWFGPIGISAIYYAQLALLEVPAEREQVRSVVVPIVYFLVLGSVMVHGISIPVLKYPQLVRTYSRQNSITNSLGFGSRRNTMVNAPSLTLQAHPVDPAIDRRADGAHIRIDISSVRPFRPEAPPTPPRAKASTGQVSFGDTPKGSRTNTSIRTEATVAEEAGETGSVAGKRKGLGASMIVTRLKKAVERFREGPMREAPLREEPEGAMERPEAIEALEVEEVPDEEISQVYNGQEKAKEVKIEMERNLQPKVGAGKVKTTESEPDDITVTAGSECADLDGKEPKCE